MSELEKHTIKELVAIHDAIDGVKPIGTWKGRKDLLIEKVGDAMKAARSQRTIVAAAKEWLTAVERVEDGKPIGYPYVYVLDRIREEFPERDTTIECLRWYNSHFNSNPGIRMPVRPRKKAVKAEPTPAPTNETVAEAPAEAPENVTADPLA